jgi:hypothetical protein
MKNHSIGCCGPVPWLPVSLDLTTLDLFVHGLTKEIICGTRICMREKLHQTMDAACHQILKKAVLCGIL